MLLRPLLSQDRQEFVALLVGRPALDLDFDRARAPAGRAQLHRERGKPLRSGRLSRRRPR